MFSVLRHDSGVVLFVSIHQGHRVPLCDVMFGEIAYIQPGNTEAQPKAPDELLEARACFSVSHTKSAREGAVLTPRGRVGEGSSPRGRAEVCLEG